MPKRLEEIRKSIAEKLRGKTNPRTKKPYTEDDFYAIAQVTWNKIKEK